MGSRAGLRGYGYWTWRLEGGVSSGCADESGEATLCVLEWEELGRQAISPSPPSIAVPAPSISPSIVSSRPPFIPPNARRAARPGVSYRTQPLELPASFPGITISATDPVRTPLLWTDDSSLLRHTRNALPGHAMRYPLRTSQQDKSRRAHRGKYGISSSAHSRST
jgi:hypothetical protein